MKADTFLDVFGQYMKPELTAPLDGGTVLRLWTEQERRAIGVAVNVFLRPNGRWRNRSAWRMRRLCRIIRPRR